MRWPKLTVLMKLKDIRDKAEAMRLYALHVVSVEFRHGAA
jgi:hypothetical protein